MGSTNRQVIFRVSPDEEAALLDAAGGGSLPAWCKGAALSVAGHRAVSARRVPKPKVAVVPRPLVPVIEGVVRASDLVGPRWSLAGEVAEQAATPVELCEFCRGPGGHHKYECRLNRR